MAEAEPSKPKRGRPRNADMGGIPCVTESRQRKEHFQAEKEEALARRQRVAADLMEARVLELAEQQLAIGTIGASLRTALGGLCDTEAPILAGMTDKREIRSHLLGRVNAILSTLAEQFNRMAEQRPTFTDAELDNA